MRNKKNIKIIYNKEDGVLSMEIGKGKSVDSDIHGNVVLDYDNKGKIIRINLYDFAFDTFRENQKALREFSRQFGTALITK